MVARWHGPWQLPRASTTVLGLGRSEGALLPGCLCFQGALSSCVWRVFRVRFLRCFFVARPCAVLTNYLPALLSSPDRGEELAKRA